MQDTDLAELYALQTFNLNNAVRRNIERYLESGGAPKQPHPFERSQAFPRRGFSKGFTIRTVP